MNLYRVDYGLTDRKSGAELVATFWEGTQADAKARYKELMAGDAYDVEITPVDVPTDKAGLLAFLNEHLRGDR